jgi:diaminopimelate epimerase
LLNIVNFEHSICKSQNGSPVLEIEIHLRYASWFMKVSFSKYHGAGNDFIIINNLDQKVSLTKEQIAAMCHRNTGVGADGLIVLGTSEVTDFEMKYYNSDGEEGSMCGNGGRCITAFANRIGIAGSACEFTSINGRHKGEIIESSDNGLRARISLQEVTGIKKYSDNYVINTGSPHFVKFVENLHKMDVFKEGKKIRWSKEFQPDGLNVNFVGIEGGQLSVITYERGVENITLSCGTGATASAIAYSLRTGKVQPFYDISTKGGQLRVRFKRVGDRFADVELEGPVAHVFDATIMLR